MPASAWVLVTTGKFDPAALPAVTALAERMQARHPDIAVRGVVLGGKPAPAAVLKLLEDAGHREVTFVPLWITLSNEETEDLDRFFRRMREVRPGLTLSVAPELGLSSAAEAAIAIAAKSARPLDEIRLEARRALATTEERRATRPPSFSRLVLVCTGGNCMSAGGWELSEILAAEVQSAGAKGIRIVRTACLGACSAAPVVHLPGEATWYGGLSAEDGRRIARDDLDGGAVCADLLLGTPLSGEAAP